jgi:hypothetical protein
MIRKIFLFISKKLNTILKFINVRILKRKTGMTVIEFIYLVLSWFQKTVIYKVLIIIYKIVLIVLTFISFGVFYSEKFIVTDINKLLYKLKTVLISIYNVIYNTISTIFNLIFNKGKPDEDPTPEPYDYPNYYNNYEIPESLENFFKEESSHWYHDGYIIGAILILLLCLGLISYKNWDSDQTIRENMNDTFFDIYNFIKNIKDTIINLIKKRKPDSSTDDLDLNIQISEVDPKLLTDPYYYTFFKKLNNLKHWPSFGSQEHDKIVTESFNSETHKYVFTHDYYKNLVESTIDFVKIRGDQIQVNTKLDHIRLVMDQTGEEYYRIKEKYPEYWGNSENQASTSQNQTSTSQNQNSTSQNQETGNFEDDNEFLNTRSYDLSFKKESSAQTIGNVEMLDYYKAYNQGVVDAMKNVEGKSNDNTHPDIKIFDSESTFARKLRGALKNDKPKSESLTEKAVRWVDEFTTIASGGNEFENTVSTIDDSKSLINDSRSSSPDLNIDKNNPSAPPAPPAPPAPSAPAAPALPSSAVPKTQSKPTSLFESLSNIANVQLKPTSEPRTVPELSAEQIMARNKGIVATSSAIKNEMIDKTMTNFDKKESPFVSKYSVTPADCDYTEKPIIKTDKPKSMLEELKQFDSNSLQMRELNDKNKNILIEMRGLDPNKYDIDQSEIDRANELIRQGVKFRWVDSSGLSYEPKTENPSLMFSSEVLNRTDEINTQKSVEASKPLNPENDSEVSINSDNKKTNWAGAGSRLLDNFFNKK